MHLRPGRPVPLFDDDDDEFFSKRVDMLHFFSAVVSPIYTYSASLALTTHVDDVMYTYKYIIGTRRYKDVSARLMCATAAREYCGSLKRIYFFFFLSFLKWRPQLPTVTPIFYSYFFTIGRDIAADAEYHRTELLFLARTQEFWHRRNGLLKTDATFAG